MRDEKGRFTKGNTFGNGRPKKDVKYYEILQSKVTPEDWGRIISKAVEQAIDGDYQARKFIAEYLMGNPEQYIELAGSVDIEILWPETEE